jgi:chromate reductase
MRMNSFSVLGIPGSLRRGSFNRALLESITPLMPNSVEFDIFDELGSVPLYNEDLDRNPAPPGVAVLRAAVARADGLVIASPEYNFSIPGPLKNALDWLSRPHGGGAMRGKAVLTMVATLARANGARALSDINRVVSTMGNLPLVQPEVVVASAPSVIDRSRGTPAIADPVVTDLLMLALQHLEAVLRNGIAAQVARHMEDGRDILERARFIPFIRDAIAGGASVDNVTERLTNAGITKELARAWIEGESPTRTTSNSHEWNGAA